MPPQALSIAKEILDGNQFALNAVALILSHTRNKKLPEQKDLKVYDWAKLSGECPQKKDILHSAKFHFK